VGIPKSAVPIGVVVDLIHFEIKTFHERQRDARLQAGAIGRKQPIQSASELVVADLALSDQSHIVERHPFPHRIERVVLDQHVLKQLVYSLCVTSDGAVPVHFKAYAGNQTDDGIHLETWHRLRTLLQHPRFIYVADCKLCTEKNLRMIDGERGFFVTVVPKTRSEVETFRDAVLARDVRWEEILRKRADRDEKAFDVIECAAGPYHLREGFTLYWYRSSQKKKHDEKDRDERIDRAIERLESLDLKRMRGPKTNAAIGKRVDEILARQHAKEWIDVEIKWDAVEKFKAITCGKPTADTTFRRIIQQVPRLHVSTNAENIARCAYGSSGH
jgi:hypothetical protein